MGLKFLNRCSFEMHVSRVALRKDKKKKELQFSHMSLIEDAITEADPFSVLLT